MTALEELQDKLGMTFNDSALLEQAITHKSYLKELQDRGLAYGKQDQQRLEFLGDAFLKFAAALEHYQMHPSASVGTLHLLKERLERGTWLHRVGVRLELERFLKVGKGEAQHSTNKRSMEDTVEALIGAVLLDQGEEAAKAVVRRFILEPYNNGTVSPEESSRLEPGQASTLFKQAWDAKYRNSKPPPKIEYVQIDGPAHAPRFRGVMKLESGENFEAEGTNHKEIKDELFRQALPCLGTFGF